MSEQVQHEKGACGGRDEERGPQRKERGRGRLWHGQVCQVPEVPVGPHREATYVDGSQGECVFLKVKKQENRLKKSLGKLSKIEIDTEFLRQNSNIFICNHSLASLAKYCKL